MPSISKVVDGIEVVASYDDQVTHQFRYNVVTNGDSYWFRYDDGWRFLEDGERSTVDRESLIDWSKDHGDLVWIKELLDELRAK